MSLIFILDSVFTAFSWCTFQLVCILLNTIRPLTLGRKNYLFYGNDA